MTDVEGWGEYITNFLKAKDVVDDKQAFICIGASGETSQDKLKVVRLQLQNNEIEYSFDLNKTNASFLKNAGIEHPKRLIGKKIYFAIIQAQNPQTNKLVASLRIARVE